MIRRHGLGALAALACAAMVAGCSAAVAHPAGTGVAVWTSSADGARRLEPGPGIALALSSDAPAGATVTIDPRERHQSIVGFGAAMTDASAELFETAMTRSARDRLFAELFGRDRLGLSFLRVPIGASDFSSTHYSLDDMPVGASDPGLAKFSMAGPMAAQIPALRAARAINPDLMLMASPWSAPGWMKDSDSLIQGRLRADFYPAYAHYFSRYLAAMARAGVPVRWVSIQNEPHFEPHDYPGLRFDPPARARFIGQFLGPVLAREAKGVGILDWDHNWDQPESPLAVLADPQAARHIEGVAWHCYAGDVAAMEQVRVAHPDKQAFLTECSGGEWTPGWQGLGWMIDNLIIAPSRFGSRGTMLWNLALDTEHGPHKGGCGDCRAVVTIDRRSGAITRNLEYYVLGHVSRFVRRGARRIASSQAGSITNAAFRNPDGSLVLVAHNAGADPARLRVREGARSFSTVLAAGEVGTFLWKESRLWKESGLSKESSSSEELGRKP
ncbi:glucosylceramidase [soil metagenome]